MTCTRGVHWQRRPLRVDSPQPEGRAGGQQELAQHDLHSGYVSGQTQTVSV